MPSNTTTKAPNQQNLKGIFTAIAVGLAIIILSSMIWVAYPASNETRNGSSCDICAGINPSERYENTQYGLPFGYYTNEGYGDARDFPFRIGLLSPAELLAIMQRTKGAGDSGEILEKPLAILYNLVFWSAIYYFVMRYLVPKLKSSRPNKQA